MKIAIDAMGGDFAPTSPVEGALNIAREGLGRFGISLDAFDIE